MLSEGEDFIKLFGDGRVGVSPSQEYKAGSM